MLSFHPIANVFPLLEGSDFAALVDNIAASGVLEPVWLYEDMILDGRNRYRACEQVGVVCRTRPYLGDDPVGFVLSMNLTRRHLDDSQRAMIAARLATMRQGERRDLLSIHKRLSQEEAAALLNVGVVTVSHANTIQQKGIAELSHAVDTGEIAVSAAVPLTALPRDKQTTALADARIQAHGRKVTATITKAIITRQEVLSTLQTALEAGLPSGAAIKQALAVHDIALATPGLADALARAVPDPVSIPATDGLYHDGRTPLEEQDRKDYVRRLFQLFNALEALAALPDAAELLSDIPEYSAHRVHEYLEPALLWLNTFASLWRNQHAELTSSLT